MINIHENTENQRLKDLLKKHKDLLDDIKNDNY